MRATGPLAALALAAAWPAGASAATSVVSMPGKYFSPAQLTVIAGDEVVFRNSDFTGDEHDVRASDGSFQTGRIGRFGSFRHTFATVGGVDYVCTVHPGMSGNVTTVGALLEAPGDPGLAGEPVPLSGRAPAGTSEVVVERLAVDGTWIAQTSAAPELGGEFTAEIRPVEPGTYRATAPAGSSAPVDVGVVSGLHLQTRVRAGAVRVAIHPAPVRAWIVLERYVRERFAWRRVARVRTRARTATLALTRRRGIARVSLERARNAPPLVIGEPFRARNGRSARDPTAGDVPTADGAPGHPGAPAHGA